VDGDTDATAPGQPPDRPASQATSEQPLRLDQRRQPVLSTPRRRQQESAGRSASGIAAAPYAVPDGSSSPRAPCRASAGRHAYRAAWSARRRELDEGRGRLSAGDLGKWLGGWVRVWLFALHAEKGRRVGLPDSAAA